MGINKYIAHDSAKTCLLDKISKFLKFREVNINNLSYESPGNFNQGEDGQGN